MGTLLSADILSHIGDTSAPQTQIVTRRDIRKYAIASGQRLPKYLAGDVAPPLFHLALFWDVVEMDQLSPDGVSIDPLLPEFPLKRAMAGGIRISYGRAILPGDVLTATRTLTNIYEKSGSQGPLIFYEVTTRVERTDGELVLTEVATRIMR
jgi:hydroxyacyl-ACP dehydratase HTD2-like protein with hotdog domain